MNTQFAHKQKRVVIPEGVQVVRADERIVVLKGRYFYGGETQQYVILQPEPFRMPNYWQWMWYYLAGFVSGIAIGRLL